MTSLPSNIDWSNRSVLSRSNVVHLKGYFFFWENGESKYDVCLTTHEQASWNYKLIYSLFPRHRRREVNLLHCCDQYGGTFINSQE
jgi:hypothetical protein